MKCKLGALEDAAFGNNVTRLLQDGRRTNSREIGFIIDTLSRSKLENALLSEDQKKDFARQAQTLFSQRRMFPQAIEFELLYNDQKKVFDIKPFNFSIPKVRQQIHSDVVLIGGDLAAITTAMKAADEGHTVSIIYSGPLGGIIDSHGANLRLFDRVPKTDYTKEQERLFDAIGVVDKVTIPPNASQKIEHFLLEAYHNRIELVPTKRCTSLFVGYTNSTITVVTTEEGNEVSGRLFFDVTPDSLIAEKMGVPINNRGPQLADGVVFDMEGVTREDLLTLGQANCITPEAICRSLGLELSDALKDPLVKKAYDAFKLQNRSRSQVTNAWALGFGAFADGFHLYMCCKGLVNKDPYLAQLNQDRIMTRFNVVITGDTANFNSISYKYPYQKLQGDAPLLDDPDTLPILRFDIPGMQEYTRLILNKQSITIRPPGELYVRKATGLVKESAMEAHLENNQLRWNNGESIETNEMSYQIDMRGIFQRDKYDMTDPRIKSLIPSDGKAHDKTWGSVVWPVLSENAHVKGSNLYLLSKSVPPASFFGGTRIIGGHIRSGSKVLDDVYTPLKRP